jgi:acyl-CoA synthetase (AMP-forming)/AMP-acid ligase II
MSLRHNLRLLRDAGSAVWASGLVRPHGHREIRCAAIAFRQFGPTPATLFAISATLYPNKTVIIDDEGSLTYAEMQAQTEELAVQCHRQAGDRVGGVAVLSRNGRNFLLALLAGAQLGRELVFLNTEFTAPQLAQALARHRPAILVHDAEYAEAVAASATNAVTVVPCVGSFASGRPFVLGTTGQRSLPRVRRPVKLTILTSGTTGLAKGVSRAISRRALGELALSTMATARLGPDDVMAISPPFFHGFGLLALVGAIAVGVTIVCHRRFDAAQAIDDIAAHGVTVQACVPVMLQRMTARVEDAATRPDLSTLRLAITGGAKVSPAAVERFNAAFGPLLANGYGSTEVGLVTLATPRDLEHQPHTLGRPILGVSVRILRNDRTPAQGSEVGTIFVRGGLGFSGYVRDPGRSQQESAGTKEVVDQHVSTGDRGYLDASGRLFLVDREDEMIISGGENIFPSEVENALTAHPLVCESAVAGITDEEYGQVLHAFVVLADSATEMTPDDLKAHLRQRLERYKQPKAYTFVESLPRNAMGKVLKAQLLAGHSATAATQQEENRSA